MLGEKLFGLLIANQCSAPREWQQFEIDLIDQLGIQVAIAIQQSSLFQQVQTLNTNLERQVEERTIQLQQKMQELQELNRIKDVVLHTVSHDSAHPSKEL
jgi:GAF domain-containing protein